MDEFSRERKLLTFSNIGIPDLFSLSKVELLTTKAPIVPHIHPGQFEICIHYEGCQYYEIDGKGYETHAGDIFISFPGEHHSTGNNQEDKSKFFYIIFDCHPEKASFMGLGRAESTYIVKKLFSIQSRLFKGANTVKPILDEAIRIYFSEDPLKVCRIYSLMIGFFYEMCRLIDNSLQPKESENPVLLVKEYIDSHPADNPSVELLARMAYLSVSQFKRRFKELSYYTPHDYMLRQKIDLAKEMLSYTYLSVTEIALATGMSSSQIFAKNFKKYTGKTPREYREHIKKLRPGL